MKTLLLASIAALTLTSAALADGVVLKSHHQAGSLHTGLLDMVAYRSDLADGGFEVTATFRARTPTAAPQRVVMRLDDQDSARFAMPSAPLTLYTFSRSGDVVEVSTEQAPMEIASQ